MTRVTILLAAIVAAGPASGTAPTTVSGRVFLDANGNGRLDPGEQGIPGVRVTDGVDFVTTDKDGAYSIRIGDDPSMPYRPAQTVGVCWPTGTWPSGPWWVRLSNVKEPAAVHFGLRAEAQKLPFVYLHMTDPHEFFNNAHADFARFVNALPPDVKFILDTGDTFRPKSAEKPFQLLFMSTVGNHDTWESSEPAPTPDEDGYNPWTNRLGPVRWSFDHAGIHFIGIDVIEELHGKRAKAMLAWLEKDLQRLPPGTRIVMAYHYPDPSVSSRVAALLKDRKLELIHGGHGHAYEYRDGPPPMILAYHWQPPGTCNALVVAKDRIDIAFYCIGCKKAFGKHSRRCPMEWADHILVSNIGRHFAKRHEIEMGPLAGERTAELSQPYAFTRATIAPGKAQRVGLRIGPEGKRLEVAFTGDRLEVDGASLPFSLRPGQKTLDLAVYAHRNMLTLWANNYFFFEKPVALEKAGRMTVFAEGGGAEVVAATVQEVKADPGNRETRYYCSCSHGSLRRNPEPK